MEIKEAVEIVKEIEDTLIERGSLESMDEEQIQRRFYLKKEALQTLISVAEASALPVAVAKDDNDDCVSTCQEVAILHKNIKELKDTLKRAHEVFGAESDKLKDIAQGELILLDVGTLEALIEYVRKTHTKDMGINIDKDIAKAIYDKFGTAHKPKIDEGKMNGGLRPLGTTGNYTDSMGNLYSKQ